MPIKYQPSITVTILSVPEKLHKNDKNNPLLGHDNFYKMTSNSLSELHQVAIEVLGLDPKKRFDPQGLFYWVPQSAKNQALRRGAHQSWQFLNELQSAAEATSRRNAQIP